MTPELWLHRVTAAASGDYKYIAIEAALTACALILAFVGSGWNLSLFSGIERWLGRLVARRTVAVFVVGAFTLAARAALLPFEPVPAPRVHDEFSYLLAADTFAHGRLTNPPHPMWRHFETFHVIQRPTYMSKYYPAQGLTLAAGQVIGGHPFWGVWLTVGLMCAAIYWMLRAWVPSGWAMYGGMLAIFRLGLVGYWIPIYNSPFTYWNDSYWGGAVTALGGALVFGALPRLRRRLCVVDSLVMGLGFGIIAASRPYEGFCLAIGVSAAATIWLWRRRPRNISDFVTTDVMPMLLVVFVSMGLVGFYFHRVTGSAKVPPYLVYQKTYDPIPLFPWHRLGVFPPYSNNTMSMFYRGWSFDRFMHARQHPFKEIANKALALSEFFLGPLLLAPIVVSIFASPGKVLRGLVRSTKLRLLLLLMAPVVIGLLLPTYFSPHYAAPLAGAFYVLLIMAVRCVRLWCWRGRPVGRQLVRMVPVFAILILVVQTATVAVQRGMFPPPQDFGRSKILAQLQSQPGDQIVVVRYSPNHNPHSEWVYNRADIDSSKVVWARDLGPASNGELLKYFSGRHPWLLEADEDPPKLLPYSNSSNTN